MEYSTIHELVELAQENNTTIADIVIKVEIEETEKSVDEIEQLMLENLKVMKKAVKEGRKGMIKSKSGLTGGEARKILDYNHSLVSDLTQNVIANALAIAEINAGMGKIVAGPTAGSSGIVPAVILAVGQKHDLSDKKLCQGLFTASGLGAVVAEKTNLAGAAGGCQAECGVASAMAAGGAVELMDGTPAMVADAFALALKNLLGLTCDPVAGLVEVPCVKRNGFAASHALTAANMALSGINSVIPADEVVEAMISIGDMMPSCLKETSQGGLAVTTTGLNIKKDID